MNKKILLSLLLMPMSQITAENYLLVINKNLNESVSVTDYVGVEASTPSIVKNTSCLDILNNSNSIGNGIYKIYPDGVTEVDVYCDMVIDGGGWTMVSSNSYLSSVIQNGTGRNNASYRLNRIEGTLGTPSPNSDFIIGSSLNDMEWSEARVTMFGFNDLSSAYNYPDNLGSYIDLKWTTLGSTASERLDSITHSSNVTTINSFGFSIHSSASYFILDGVRKDVSYNANSNQATVGGAGVANSNGDPSNGTYFGHGYTEVSNSVEGAYQSNGTYRNSHGYVTWIR